VEDGSVRDKFYFELEKSEAFHINYRCRDKSSACQFWPYPITTTEIKTIIDTVRMHHHETQPYGVARLLRKTIADGYKANQF